MSFSIRVRLPPHTVVYLVRNKRKEFRLSILSEQLYAERSDTWILKFKKQDFFTAFIFYKTILFILRSVKVKFSKGVEKMQKSWYTRKRNNGQEN